MRLLIIIFLFVWGNFLFAQTLSHTIIASTGNSFENKGYHISSTVSELVVSTFSGIDYFLTQGFQQPSLVIGTNPEDNIISFHPYPNPVIDKLKISFIGDELTGFIIEIYSLNGIKLETKNMSELFNFKNTLILDLSNYKDGLYIIRIYSPNHKINRVYKIEKI